MTLLRRHALLRTCSISTLPSTLYCADNLDSFRGDLGDWRRCIVGRYQHRNSRGIRNPCQSSGVEKTERGHRQPGALVFGSSRGVTIWCNGDTHGIWGSTFHRSLSCVTHILSCLPACLIQLSRVRLTLLARWKLSRGIVVLGVSQHETTEPISRRWHLRKG